MLRSLVDDLHCQPVQLEQPAADFGWLESVVAECGAQGVHIVNDGERLARVEAGLQRLPFIIGHPSHARTLALLFRLPALRSIGFPVRLKGA